MVMIAAAAARTAIVILIIRIVAAATAAAITRTVAMVMIAAAAAWTAIVILIVGIVAAATAAAVARTVAVVMIAAAAARTAIVILIVGIVAAATAVARTVAMVMIAAAAVWRTYRRLRTAAAARRQVHGLLHKHFILHKIGFVKTRAEIIAPPCAMRSARRGRTVWTAAFHSEIFVRFHPAARNPRFSSYVFHRHSPFRSKSR